MVDIDSLMELFDEMEESEIEKLCLTMNTKAGANFSLIITPPARLTETSCIRNCISASGWQVSKTREHRKTF